MKTESFVFYTSWLEAIEELDEQEQLSAFKAILRYQAYHEEPDIIGAPKAMFKMAKPLADNLYNRRMASQENGKKGGRKTKVAQSEETEDKANGNLEKPRLNLEEPRHNLEEPSHNLYGNVNGNVNGNGNVKRFTPPTIEEVKAYCAERHNSVDPERFIDFYASKGWKVGNQAMKDWRAAVRTWERRDPKPEQLPTYDTAFNQVMTSEEEDELLKLMGKEKNDDKHQ